MLNFASTSVAAAVPAGGAPYHGRANGIVGTASPKLLDLTSPYPSPHDAVAAAEQHQDQQRHHRSGSGGGLVVVPSTFHYDTLHQRRRDASSSPPASVVESYAPSSPDFCELSATTATAASSTATAAHRFSAIGNRVEERTVTKDNGKSEVIKDYHDDGINDKDGNSIINNKRNEETEKSHDSATNGTAKRSGGGVASILPWFLGGGGGGSSAATTPATPNSPADGTRRSQSTSVGSVSSNGANGNFIQPQQKHRPEEATVAAAEGSRNNNSNRPPLSPNDEEGNEALPLHLLLEAPRSRKSSPLPPSFDVTAVVAPPAAAVRSSSPFPPSSPSSRAAQLLPPSSHYLLPPVGAVPPTATIATTTTSINVSTPPAMVASIYSGTVDGGPTQRRGPVVAVASQAQTQRGAGPNSPSPPPQQMPPATALLRRFSLRQIVRRLAAPFSGGGSGAPHPYSPLATNSSSAVDQHATSSSLIDNTFSGKSPAGTALLNGANATSAAQPIAHTAAISLSRYDHLLYDEEATASNRIKKSVLWREMLNLATPTSLMIVVGFATQGMTVAFIGQRLGSDAIGLFSIGNSVFNLFGISIGFGLTAALDTLVSQSFGRHKQHSSEIGEYVQRATAINLALTVPVGLFFLFGEPVFNLMFGDEIGAGVAAYTRHTIPYMVLYLIAETFIKVLQAIDEPHLPFGATLASAVACWFFNYYFMTGSFVSAAWVMTATYAVQVAALLLICFCHPRITFWRHCEWFRPRVVFAPGAMREYMRIGVPSLAACVAEWWAFEVIQIIAAGISIRQVAALNITMNVSGLLFSLSLGVCTAASVKVGNALGEDKPALARRFAGVSIAFDQVMNACTCTLLLVFRSWIGPLFTSEEDMLSEFHFLALILAVYHWGDSTQIALQGVFRGVGKQSQAVAPVLFALWFVGLPLSYLFGRTMGLGAAGIMCGLVIGFAVEVPLLLRCMGGWDWRLLAAEASRAHGGEGGAVVARGGAEGDAKQQGAGGEKNGENDEGQNTYHQMRRVGHSSSVNSTPQTQLLSRSPPSTGIGGGGDSALLLGINAPPSFAHPSLAHAAGNNKAYGGGGGTEQLFGIGGPQARVVSDSSNATVASVWSRGQYTAIGSACEASGGEGAQQALSFFGHHKSDLR